MIKKASHIISLCAALLLGACQNGTSNTQDTAPMDPASQVTKGQWVLVSGQSNGKALNIKDGTVTLNIDKKEGFTGNSAVNNYNVPAKIHGSTIEHTGEISVTLMAGSMEAMRLESSYLEAMREVKTIKQDGEKLILSADGIELKFSPAP
ncbi:MAG: META domain-containing protein [Cardiobacteriaceae bacterium]|nr:META domain-containing protein [Cardiobacteriaceae bacterium]